jgi:hypothetical protein
LFGDYFAFQHIATPRRCQRNSAGGHRDATMILAHRHGLSEGLGKGTTASVEPNSEQTQLDCGPDPTLPVLRASSASFVKIFLPAMRPDSQAPVI